MTLGNNEFGSWCRLGMVVVGLAACAGCGKGLATVEGNVTFDGQPVEKGTIVFEPADGVGPTGGGAIENGKYRITVETEKLLPISNYFKGQGRFRHLGEKDLEYIQENVIKEYEELKKKCKG